MSRECEEHTAEEWCPGCGIEPPEVVCFHCKADVRKPALCHECAEGYEDDPTPRRPEDFADQRFAHLAKPQPSEES